MNCPACGASIQDCSVSCAHCGNPLTSKSVEPTQPEVYHCETCGEELEYITTYKQWYCYNCQSYINLPAPGAAPARPVESTQKEQNTQSLIDPDDNSEPSIATAVSASDDEPFEVEFETEIDTEDEVEPESDAEIEDIDWIMDEEVDIDTDADTDLEDFIELEEDFQDLENLEVFSDIEDSEQIDYKLELESETQSEPEFNEEPMNLSEPRVKPVVDEQLRKEVEELEPEQPITLGESSIEEVSESDVEIEFNSDESEEEDDFEASMEAKESDGYIETPELKKKSMTKLHAAWVKVSSLKKKHPSEQRLIEIVQELNDALRDEVDPRDGIVLAEDCLEEANALEKELEQSDFGNVSNIYHFVNSKLVMAKKLGFTVNELEDELDNISSLIAMSNYSEASRALRTCLDKIRTLPKSQGELLTGLDEKTEQLQDLLEPLPGEKS